MRVLVIIVVLLCLLIGLFVAEDIAMDRLTGHMAEQLDKVREAVVSQGDVAAALADAERTWESVREWLLVLSNHKDVDNVAKSILSVRLHLHDGQNTEALQELEMAKFLLLDMPLKEKLSLVNIF